ncbi:MAG: FAD-dependent thymidylate synthase [Actinobacteria bacterium]|nr:FAD-dependent thymidylate synthase [Actinomycetota bacterium]MCL5887685.1 FAD-dependent thymidylate synthase [Actinomycetota bacterium]
MDVRLLFHTQNPERAVAAAARLCYAPVGAAELLEEMPDQAVTKVLRTIMTSGHFSALEHATYAFAIEGVSRALTHQLVRHRLASYNQQSQRYVSYDSTPAFIVPPAVESDPEVRERFLGACDAAFRAYRELIEAGLSPEDARYLLPNAMETKIVVSMNIRELLHFFELRCCKRAQWEIRELASRMLQLAEATAPYIFMDAGASCRRGACREGKMTCGSPYERAPRRD